MIGGAHRLAVEDRRRGRGWPAAALAVGHDEGMVDALSDTLALPAAQIIIDRLPWGQIMGQKPPRHADPQKIEDGIHQFAGCRLPRPAAGLRMGDHGRDQIPLSVSQVSVVSPPCRRLLPGHAASARLVIPTPYESRQSPQGKPSQTRSNTLAQSDLHSAPSFSHS